MLITCRSKCSRCSLGRSVPVAAPRPALQATFRASDLTEAVHDVCWSPTSSTVFALATGDGRIEVWRELQGAGAGESAAMGIYAAQV